MRYGITGGKARQGGLLIEFAEVLHSLTNAQIGSLQREGERECGFSLCSSVYSYIAYVYSFRAEFQRRSPVHKECLMTGCPCNSVT